MNIFDLKSVLTDPQNLYAHIRTGLQNETILEHSELTYKYFQKIIALKGIDKVFNNFIDSFKLDDNFLSDNEKEFVLELIHNTIFLHDFGKINPRFQTDKMKNPNLTKKQCHKGDSNHSLLSAVLFINTYKNNMYVKNNKLIKVLLYVFAYLQSKHHGHIKDLQNFSTKLETLIGEIQTPTNVFNYTYFYNQPLNFINNKVFDLNTTNNILEQNPQIYLLTKLLFALLTGCDFYATGEYMNQLEIKNFGLISAEFFKDYENWPVYENIQKYKNGENPFGNNGINNLRSDIFIEAETNLLNNISQNVFYLEAPTGSGKTNTSINLAKNIIQQCPEINKVFYIFPFNTLVEQTYGVFKDIFSDNKKIGIINSITPIIIEKNDNVDQDEDYDTSLTNRQFLNYPVVLTSHVNFFNYLFGIGREQSFPLTHLCNSVVIIDEIQTYNNSIWKEIIYMFEQYAKFLNIKFIIMSATLPKLSMMLNTPICSLITNPQQYYNSTYFKNRVQIDFNMINNKYDKDNLSQMVEDILEQIKKSNVINEMGQSQNGKAKVLIEFITKKTCRLFFKMLKDMNSNDFTVLEISGADNKFKRNKILDQIKKFDVIKENKSLIVCTTQVIEAGVDIDMDLGFKDISMLENEEQFLGRINRSCKKQNCWGYFFDLFSAKKIYRNDVRLNNDLKNSYYQNYLINKDFSNHYNYVFNALSIKYSMIDGTSTKWDNFIEMVYKCKFKTINKIMRLICGNNYELYLPLKIPKEDCDERVWTNYINLCGLQSILDGKIVWDAYRKLIKNWQMSYSEKQIKLSQMNEILINFTIATRQEPNLSNSIGRMYYLENYEQYMDNGLFDVAKYEKNNSLGNPNLEFTDEIIL